MWSEGNGNDKNNTKNITEDVIIVTLKKIKSQNQNQHINAWNHSPDIIYHKVDI